jgi:hypothetical protein
VAISRINRGIKKDLIYLRLFPKVRDCCSNIVFKAGENVCCEDLLNHKEGLNRGKRRSKIPQEIIGRIEVVKVAMSKDEKISIIIKNWMSPLLVLKTKGLY